MPYTQFCVSITCKKVFFSSVFPVTSYPPHPIGPHPAAAAAAAAAAFFQHHHQSGGAASSAMAAAAVSAALSAGHPHPLALHHHLVLYMLMLPEDYSNSKN
jgi:hypothetical protein